MDLGPSTRFYANDVAADNAQLLAQKNRMPKRPELMHNKDRARGARGLLLMTGVSGFRDRFPAVLGMIICCIDRRKQIILREIIDGCVFKSCFSGR